jgi:hypothetical protein
VSAVLPNRNYIILPYNLDTLNHDFFRPESRFHRPQQEILNSVSDPSEWHIVSIKSPLTHCNTPIV